MIVLRRRLVYWLIKEYIKKWRKTILLCFVVGLVAFFSLQILYKPIFSKITLTRKESIGLVGTYTLDTLPTTILQQLSQGLTTVSSDGSIKGDLATSWKIENDGKRYIFDLRKDAYFSDGKSVTSDLVDYNFSGVSVKKLSKYTLVFDLKENYAPFLISVSRPVFRKGFIGTGEYKITDVKLNGNFVQTVTLSLVKNQYSAKIYRFYSNTNSLKTAFLLGEIQKAEGLADTMYKNTSFVGFPNARVDKNVNYTKLVTLFYNTKDQYLSQRDVRTGLSLAIPDDILYGKRAYTLFPPMLWAYREEYLYTQDLSNAKLLTKDLKSNDNNFSATITIKTLPKYKDVAGQISKAWGKIGIKSKTETVDTIPSAFQIFLGDFSVPKDPDQYSLWHTGQESNITKYENKRIDKLLEDGRKTIDMTERKKIYADFQKYLLADSPAAFLFFPYEYTITRK